MTDPRPPYTGPIWRQRPTALDVLLFPVACVYMGVTLAAVGVAAFLLNSRGRR